MGQPSPPIPSQDGAALQVVVPLDGEQGFDITPDVDEIRRIARDTPGLSASVTGPAGLLANFGEVFKTIDSTLLFATAGVLVVILERPTQRLRISCPL